MRIRYKGGVASIFIVSILCSSKLYCQDFINIGATHDFNKSSLFETFSMDFNRTESVSEKPGKALLYTRTDIYIIPTSSVNIGDGTTSSANNILAQIVAGKVFPGRRITNNLTFSNWDHAVEINPSFNSDKNFVEKLGYGQLKFLTSYKSLIRTSSDTSTHPYDKSVLALSFGVFTNLGDRFSKTYNTEHAYITAGLLFDLTYSLLNKKNDKEPAYENWIFKLAGNYYYIASEVEKLTSDKYAGSLNVSINKRFYKSIYLGLTYKYGTDNPTYVLINTLELSFKVKY
jgi:hypothetical protein